MSIKAVLFDLDNTLVDFVGMKKRATRAAACAMVDSGLKEDAEALSTELFDFYLGYWIEADDAFEKFLQKKYGKIDIRLLAAGVNAYLKEKYNHLHAYPGVKETLAELKERGLKLAVVSDGMRLKAWMRLNEAGIDGFFDVVVTFDDTGKKKPSSEPFRRAVDELGVLSGECVFVGDWPERDIAGAKALGMTTVLARYGWLRIGEDHKADYEIDNIKEILGVVSNGK
ncbi:MAG: TIGR02253 family HAD-type hydrolase [Candidatus Altiarchaeia archaeon]